MKFVMVGQYQHHISTRPISFSYITVSYCCRCRPCYLDVDFVSIDLVIFGIVLVCCCRCFVLAHGYKLYEATNETSESILTYFNVLQSCEILRIPFQLGFDWPMRVSITTWKHQTKSAARC